MELVHFPNQVGGHPSGHVPAFGAAVEAFFAYKDLAPSSQRAYRAALEPLVVAVGADQPLAAVTPDVVSELFTERWAGRAAATWNVRRAAVRAFVSWCEDRWPFGVDPLALVGARTRTVDRTRSIPYPALDALIRRRSVPLREKALWRMLYETAARASEVLALDVEDLDRPQRRARVRSKGGDTDLIFWASATSRLLARYLAGRTRGPLFLTVARARTYPAASDLYHPTGQARLTYRTAAATFRRHTGGDWTLHQLRHSALTHLAEAGASSIMLRAKSRHSDLRTLDLYANPGPEAVGRLTSDQFDRV
ncbi:MAG: site-specific integrase [bacterium]|nr:site-specific integrase [bacterium]MDE0287543.1 site-specific integrase [bacterium]MDE0437680.1 site-specific integrase [bacterium]